jgi:diaminopimelate decarboxylase
MLPPMSRGQLLLVKCVGAYNMAQSMQFIHERPAIVMISEAGEAEMIRRRETISDVIGPELLPDRLKLETPKAAHV